MSKYSNNINKYYSYDKKKEIDLLRKVNSVTLNPPNLKEIKEEKKDKIKPNLVPVAAASKCLDGSVKKNKTSKKKERRKYSKKHGSKDTNASGYSKIEVEYVINDIVK